MNWKLSVGGNDLSSFLRDGASFTEIASSSDGSATFTVNGQHAAIVKGAAVQLLDSDGDVAWEGSIVDVAAQLNAAGDQIASLVRAVPLSASFAIGVTGGSYQNVDVGVLAAQIASGTSIPWGGPATLGVEVGALSFSRADEGLTTLATLADALWRVQDGVLVFVSGKDSVTPIPVALAPIPNSVSSISILGGVDSATRIPIATHITPSEFGPAVHVAQPEISDPATLAIYAGVLAQRYGIGAISALASFPSVTLRAGDWVRDQKGATAVVYSTSYKILSGQLLLTAQCGFPSLPTDPQYAASFADEMHRYPVARVHGDFVLLGGDGSVTPPLMVAITVCDIGIADTVYVFSAATVDVPDNAASQIFATAAGYSVLPSSATPIPGQSIAMYRVTANNGTITELRDLRTRGGYAVRQVDPNSRPIVDLTQVAHIGKSLANIADDASTQRYAVLAVDSGRRALVDFSQPGHIDGALTDGGGLLLYARTSPEYQDNFDNIGVLKTSAGITPKVPNSVAYVTDATIGFSWTGTGPYAVAIWYDNGTAATDAPVEFGDGTSINLGHSTSGSPDYTESGVAGGTNYYAVLTNVGGVTTMHVQKTPFTLTQRAAFLSDGGIIPAASQGRTPLFTASGSGGSGGHSGGGGGRNLN